MNGEKLRPTARQLLRAFQVRSARSRDLANALAKGELKTFMDGETLCSEGDTSDDMYVIIKGSVKVIKDLKIRKSLPCFPRLLLLVRWV